MSLTYIFEYRYFGEGTCRFGSRCSQAHSEEELDEWKERFEQKKERLTLAKEGDAQSNNYAEQLMKTWMNADNPESVVSICQSHPNLFQRFMWYKET